MIRFRFRLQPATRKRLDRFRNTKRAYVCFWLLSVIFVLSLFINFIANDKPILAWYKGQLFFPAFGAYYPDDTFTGSGIMTRPDYKAINATPEFRKNGWMLFPLIPYGPAERISPSAIVLPDHVQVEMHRQPRVGTVNIQADGKIASTQAAAAFFEVENDRELTGQPITDTFQFPEAMSKALAARFANQAAPAGVYPSGKPGIEFALTEYKPRSRASATVRFTIRDADSGTSKPVKMAFDRNLQAQSTPPLWESLPVNLKEQITSRVKERFESDVDRGVAPLNITTEEGSYLVKCDREVVSYPFRPCPGHPLGIDTFGRDVQVQIYYATRISLLFGMLLVIAEMVIGILIGGVQGFFAGKVDMVGQRLIEIWQALPFLYIVILLSSIYGRSFGLLLTVYALFGWIGISLYVRGDFLKLRKQQFVESAKVMGVSRFRIMFKHILPNALAPIITILPFALVGAIFSLSALDFLGFGLPAGTPSWGQMLQMGLEKQTAWWLILYPSLALFIVMLLAVFIGEGVRNAFDPRSLSKLE